jgi:hypothetical protein
MARRILGRRILGVALMKAGLLALLVPSLALAQTPARELQVDTTRGPTSELYIKKRPVTPEAPVLNAELKKLLASSEKKRDDKRIEAITLLRQFLASKPMGDTKADGMFKLAELLWEESRRLYLVRIDEYSRAIEKLYADTRRVLDNAKLGKIDAIIGQKRKLDIEVQDLAAGRFPEELIGKLWNASMIADDEEYWPWQGEYWADEYSGWR